MVWGYSALAPLGISVPVMPFVLEFSFFSFHLNNSFVLAVVFADDTTGKQEDGPISGWVLRLFIHYNNTWCEDWALLSRTLWMLWSSAAARNSSLSFPHPMGSSQLWVAGIYGCGSWTGWVNWFDLELTFSLFFFFLSAFSFKPDIFSSLIPWEKWCPEWGLALCWPGCALVWENKNLELRLKSWDAQTSTFCEISQVVWVRLGGKTNNEFGFLCVEGIVCSGIYFLSICSYVFCTSRAWSQHRIACLPF